MAGLYEKVVRSGDQGTPLFFGGAVENVHTTKVVTLPQNFWGRIFWSGFGVFDFDGVGVRC